MLYVEAQDISLESQARCRQFFEKLVSARLVALLLDYDGTLAPFCADRQRALPYPAVRELLGRIQNGNKTRLVVISGRRASEVGPLLGVEHVEIWGSHGLERVRADGSYELPLLSSAALTQLSHVDDLLAQAGLQGLAEIKPGGTAVHWRGLGPQRSAHIRKQVEEAWESLSDREGLHLVEFDGGLEVRLADRDKADAVRAVLDEVGPNVPVAYLGDDQTDESAFRALQSRGLSVLVRREWRPTVADAWLKPPEQLVAFLADWAKACEGAA